MKGPNLSFADVVRASDNFIKTYHPSRVLPIPIEKIVEHKMDISLFTVPDIKFLLGVDAFISADFTQITIDERCFVRYPERTRFSIAHEVGHLILHKDWYEKYGPKNFQDFITSHDRMDNEIYKYTEIQAQTFAGLVLVPRDLLFNELKKKLGRVPSMVEPEVLATVIQDIPDIFDVSDSVILRRLQREGVIKFNS